MADNEIVRVAVFEPGAARDQSGRELGDDWPILNLGECEDNGATVWLCANRVRSSEFVDLVSPLIDPRVLGDALVATIQAMHAHRVAASKAVHSRGYWRTWHAQREQAQREELEAWTDRAYAAGEAHPELCWAQVVAWAMDYEEEDGEPVEDCVPLSTTCADSLTPGASCYCGRWRRSPDGDLQEAPAVDGGE